MINREKRLVKRDSNEPVCSCVCSNQTGILTSLWYLFCLLMEVAVFIPDYLSLFRQARQLYFCWLFRKSGKVFWRWGWIPVSHVRWANSCCTRFVINCRAENTCTFFYPWAFSGYTRVVVDDFIYLKTDWVGKLIIICNCNCLYMSQNKDLIILLTFWPHLNYAYVRYVRLQGTIKF